MRTALALFAAGVALETLRIREEAAIRLAAATFFVLLGVAATVQAWSGWARTERSLRENRALPGPTIGVVLTFGILVAVGLLVVGYVW